MKKTFYFCVITLLSLFIKSFELFADMPIICEKIPKDRWEAGCRRDCPEAVKRGMFKEYKGCFKECMSRFADQCKNIK